MRSLAAVALVAGTFLLTATSSAANAGGTKQAAGFNCVAACSAYESTINQYFADVAADSGKTTNVYSVATQYSGIQYSETFGGTYLDGNPFPTNDPILDCVDGVDTYCVTDAQLQEQIGRAIAKNHWPMQSSTTLYFIFTPANVGVCFQPGQPDLQSNECTTNRFCAYHRSLAQDFIYAVAPDAAAVGGGGSCDTGEAPAGNHADATINMISHEQNEAITDPYLDAWRANDGLNQTPKDEIADLCSWEFGTPQGVSGALYNQVINGHDYLLQLEYSNQDGGCVPYLGGAAIPSMWGAGPLILPYPESMVMTTNTVYAIYWVPAPPANRALPTISGFAKVGNRLKAAHGSWSHLPKFAYRWLRCSKAGASCTGIRRATGSSYGLVKADAGHRLEVRVTATNQAGRASAISVPTARVRK